MYKIKRVICVLGLIGLLATNSYADTFGRYCETSGITVEELGPIAPSSLLNMKQNGVSKTILTKQFDELVWRLIVDYKYHDATSAEESIILYDPHDVAPNKHIIYGAEYKRYLSHLLLGNLAYDLELDSRAKQNLIEAVETWMGHTGHGTHFINGHWGAKQPDPFCKLRSIASVLGVDLRGDYKKEKHAILEIRIEQLTKLSDRLGMYDLSQALYEEYLAPEILPTQIEIYEKQVPLPDLSLGELMEIAKSGFEDE